MNRNLTVNQTKEIIQTAPLLPLITHQPRNSHRPLRPPNSTRTRPSLGAEEWDALGLVEFPVGRNRLLAPSGSAGLSCLAPNATPAPSQALLMAPSACSRSVRAQVLRGEDLLSLHRRRVGSYLPLPAKMYFLGPVPRGAMSGRYCVNCWTVKEPCLTHLRPRACRAPVTAGAPVRTICRWPLSMALPAQRVGTWELFMGARSPLLPACVNR